MSNKLSELMSTPSVDELYVLVKWPFVQNLMDADWFRAECILYQAFDDQEYFDSAYFVPLHRFFEFRDAE